MIINRVTIAVSSAPTEAPSVEDGDARINCTPSSQSLVQCSLVNIVKERHRVDVDILVNQCHKPVDITFFLRVSYHVIINNCIYDYHNS